MTRSARNRFILRAAAGYAVLASVWIFFSDRILGLIVEPDLVAAFATAKGIAFVIVTSALLVLALRRVPRGSAATLADAKAWPWPHTIAATALMAGIALLAWSIYHVQAGGLKNDAFVQLQAVARLKSLGVSNWMDERRANVRNFSGDPIVLAAVAQWRATGDREATLSLRDTLRRTRTAYGFHSITLLDQSGLPLIGDDLALPAQVDLGASLQEVMRTGDIAFLDLSRERGGGEVHMAYLAPLSLGAGAHRQPLGFALFDMRPRDYLYPYLLSWPLPSASGEIVLFRHDGDSIIFLNEMRHRHGSALSLRAPVGDSDLPAAQFVRDHESLVEGNDYRGVKVLAAATFVSGTPWSLIAKVDRDEALSSARLVGMVFATLTVLALAASAAFVGYLWQRQHLRSALSTIAAQQAEELADERFRATFEQAAVGIAHLAPDGRYLRANPCLCRMLDYSLDEIQKMNVRDVIAADDIALLQRNLQDALSGKVEGYSGEKRYKRRDGGIAWVESTVSLVRDGDGQPDYFIVVATDISKRKEVERALHASEERFQLAMDGANDGLWDWDLLTDTVYYSPRWKSMLGYLDAELPNSIETWHRLADPKDRLRAEAQVREIVEGRSNHYEIECRIRHKDGHYVDVLSRAVPLRRADGTAIRLVGTHVDITERKATEAALRERVNLQDYLVKVAKTVPGTICSFRQRADGTLCMPYASPNLAELLGVAPGDVAGDAAPAFARLNAADAGRIRASLAESVRTLSNWRAEFRVWHPAKGERWIEGLATPEHEADGGTLLHGFLHDVTERKLTEDQLRQAATVFTSSQEGIVITGSDGGIKAVNPAFCTITGYGESELIGKNMRVLQSGRHNSDFYKAMWASVAEVGYWQGEIWNRRKNGELFPELLTISSVRDDLGKIAAYVGSFTDITGIKQSEAQLEKLAHHDPLTGLPNRLLLRSRLEHAITRATRSGKRGALLFLDLDRFKTVNDSLGHPAGDELLLAVAQRLRGRLRESDTIARLGGDEFVVLLEEVAGPQQVASLSQSLIDNLAMPFTLSEGHEVYIGTSIGISLFPDDSADVDILIQQADSALYQAKEHGRGVCRFYTMALTEAANTRLLLEARLRRALERDEFLMHYQPLVAMKDRRIIGVEALMRWQDPEKGMISPAQFIPLAEETGVIIPLGEMALRAACRQMKAWLDAGLALETVAVNLSPRQFRQGDIQEVVRGILLETGLPARHLELEITEGAIMEQGQEAEAKLEWLRELGVHVAIDDFGTGYSSLAYLKRFRINKLKVDQSFVRNIPGDSADMEIATAIIGLGKTLGLEILAEGVETEAQLAFLQAKGCDAAQGYLFSRPVPAAEIAPLIARRHGVLGAA